MYSVVVILPAQPFSVSPQQVSLPSFTRAAMILSQIISDTVLVSTFSTLPVLSSSSLLCAVCCFWIFDPRNYNFILTDTCTCPCFIDFHSSFLQSIPPRFQVIHLLPTLSTDVHKDSCLTSFVRMSVTNVNKKEVVSDVILLPL